VKRVRAADGREPWPGYRGKCGRSADEFGHYASLCHNETLRFEEYTSVVFSLFEPEERLQRRSEIFPRDYRRSFDLGVRRAKAVTL